MARSPWSDMRTCLLRRPLQKHWETCNGMPFGCVWSYTGPSTFRPPMLRSLEFLFVGAMMLAPVVHSQSATINGYVTDAANSETLIQANVLVEGTSRGAATNTSGFYILSDLDPGTYELRVSYLGFTTARETVTPAAGETRRIDFALVSQSFQTEEIRVEAA